MPKPGYTGFSRVYRATVFSWQGLKAAWQHESAFRQECVVGLFLLPVAFVIGQSMVEVAVLISVMTMVLIAELLNSAVEAVVDRVGDELHELAGRAKDMGSAAVFVSIVLMLAVWAMMIVRNFLLS